MDITYVAPTVKKKQHKKKKCADARVVQGPAGPALAACVCRRARPERVPKKSCPKTLPRSAILTAFSARSQQQWAGNFVGQEKYGPFQNGILEGVKFNGEPSPFFWGGGAHFLLENGPNASTKPLQAICRCKVRRIQVSTSSTEVTFRPFIGLIWS